MATLAIVLPAIISLRVETFKIDRGFTPVQAVTTNEFLNSIGANLAISSRGESIEKTVEAVKYTGIRWIRSGYEGGTRLW
jgi:hypothetical protein